MGNFSGLCLFSSLQLGFFILTACGSENFHRCLGGGFSQWTALASRCAGDAENDNNRGDDLDELMTAEEFDNDWEVFEEDEDEDFVPDHGKEPSASKTVRRKASQKEGSSS